MSLLALASMVFFLAYGISHFFPFRHSDKIAAVAAIIVGVLSIINMK